MKKGNERHLFPGNNTPMGFYSYYDYILPQNEANHIFCLKGGPGVGKSTFMKTTGQKMNEKGYDVEYLHCSSDPDSLDGVVFPQINIAMIDGTAPHVVDPINPGAVDEIINLGEYWDLDGIKQNKNKVIKINAEIGNQFKRLYRYLAAAKCMFDDIDFIFKQSFNSCAAATEAYKICNKFFKESIGKVKGRTRKQFAGAITPKGIIHYVNTLYVESFDVYLINNNWGAGVSDFLQRINDYAVMRGYNTELYYCPMNPENQIEHLIIPKLKIAFISRSNLYSIDVEEYASIDLRKHADKSIINKNSEYIELAGETAKELLKNAVNMLSKAKQLHDEMENYYVPHMDFSKEKEKMEEILDRILKMGE